LPPLGFRETSGEQGRPLRDAAVFFVDKLKVLRQYEKDWEVQGLRPWWRLTPANRRVHRLVVALDERCEAEAGDPRVRAFYGQHDLDALLGTVDALPKTPSAWMPPVLRN
jgi:hypothetical protein